MSTRATAQVLSNRSAEPAGDHKAYGRLCLEGALDAARSVDQEHTANNSGRADYEHHRGIEPAIVYRLRPEIIAGDVVGAINP